MRLRMLTTMASCSFSGDRWWGAHKFEERHQQVLPKSFLKHFESHIHFVSTLICIGYGFGDLHINQVLRDWLERDAERCLEIVSPAASVPPFLLHLAPQVTAFPDAASDYLDKRTGVARTRDELLERRLGVWIRTNRKNPDAPQQFTSFIRERQAASVRTTLERIGGQFRDDGGLHLAGPETTSEEWVRRLIGENELGHEDLLEAFLDAHERDGLRLQEKMRRTHMVKIYTDTNVLRYFGEAFATRSVPQEIAVQLLLAPLAILELLSQLGTADAESAFAAIQALPRVHNPAACGMLPWSDDFFRMCLFKLPPSQDSVTQSINNAVNNVLNATNAADLATDGAEMRALLDKGKNEAVGNFTDLSASAKAEGILDPAEDRRIFAQSITRRAGVEPASVDVDFVLTHLDAHYRFEQQRINAAVDNPEYNVRKRANDVYDAELLIYLADPSLHLLTCDAGFKRASGSSQANRIHIVPADALRAPDTAITTLEKIVESAERGA